jgi:hypothetical protein
VASTPTISGYKPIVYFKIEGGFGFKTKEDAEHWASRKTTSPRQQIHVTFSPITRDWSAEVQT